WKAGSCRQTKMHSPTTANTCHLQPSTDTTHHSLIASNHSLSPSLSCVPPSSHPSTPSIYLSSLLLSFPLLHGSLLSHPPPHHFPQHNTNTSPQSYKPSNPLYPTSHTHLPHTANHLPSLSLLPSQITVLL